MAAPPPPKRPKLDFSKAGFSNSSSSSKEKKTIPVAAKKPDLSKSQSSNSNSSKSQSSSSNSSGKETKVAAKDAGGNKQSTTRRVLVEWCGLLTMNSAEWKNLPENNKQLARAFMKWLVNAVYLEQERDMDKKPKDERTLLPAFRLVWATRLSGTEPKQRKKAQQIMVNVLLNSTLEFVQDLMRAHLDSEVTNKFNLIIRTKYPGNPENAFNEILSNPLRVAEDTEVLQAQITQQITPALYWICGVEAGKGKTLNEMAAFDELICKCQGYTLDKDHEKKFRIRGFYSWNILQMFNGFNRDSTQFNTKVLGILPMGQEFVESSHLPFVLKAADRKFEDKSKLPEQIAYILQYIQDKRRALDQLKLSAEKKRSSSSSSSKDDETRLLVKTIDGVWPCIKYLRYLYIYIRAETVKCQTRLDQTRLLIERARAQQLSATGLEVPARRTLLNAVSQFAGLQNTCFGTRHEPNGVILTFLNSVPGQKHASIQVRKDAERILQFVYPYSRTEALRYLPPAGKTYNDEQLYGIQDNYVDNDPDKASGPWRNWAAIVATVPSEAFSEAVFTYERQPYLLIDHPGVPVEQHLLSPKVAEANAPLRYGARPLTQSTQLTSRNRQGQLVGFAMQFQDPATGKVAWPKRPKMLLFLHSANPYEPLKKMKIQQDGCVFTPTDLELLLTLQYQWLDARDDAVTYFASPQFRPLALARLLQAYRASENNALLDAISVAGMQKMDPETRRASWFDHRVVDFLKSAQDAIDKAQHVTIPNLLINFQDPYSPHTALLQNNSIAMSDEEAEMRSDRVPNACKRLAEALFTNSVDIKFNKDEQEVLQPVFEFLRQVQIAGQQKQEKFTAADSKMEEDPQEVFRKATVAEVTDKDIKDAISYAVLDKFLKEKGHHFSVDSEDEKEMRDKIKELEEQIASQKQESKQSSSSSSSKMQDDLGSLVAKRDALQDYLQLLINTTKSLELDSIEETVINQRAAAAAADGLLFDQPAWNEDIEDDIRETEIHERKLAEEERINEGRPKPKPKPKKPAAADGKAAKSSNAPAAMSSDDDEAEESESEEEEDATEEEAVKRLDAAQSQLVDGLRRHFGHGGTVRNTNADLALYQEVASAADLKAAKKAFRRLHYAEYGYRESVFRAVLFLATDLNKMEMTKKKKKKKQKKEDKMDVGPEQKKEDKMDTGPEQKQKKREDVDVDILARIPWMYAEEENFAYDDKYASVHKISAHFLDQLEAVGAQQVYEATKNLDYLVFVEIAKGYKLPDGVAAAGAKVSKHLDLLRVATQTLYRFVADWTGLHQQQLAPFHEQYGDLIGSVEKEDPELLTGYIQHHIDQALAKWQEAPQDMDAREHWTRLCLGLVLYLMWTGTMRLNVVKFLTSDIPYERARLYSKCYNNMDRATESLNYWSWQFPGASGMFHWHLDLEMVVKRRRGMTQVTAQGPEGTARAYWHSALFQEVFYFAATQRPDVREQLRRVRRFVGCNPRDLLELNYMGMAAQQTARDRDRFRSPRVPIQTTEYYLQEEGKTKRWDSGYATLADFDQLIRDIQMEFTASLSSKLEDWQQYFPEPVPLHLHLRNLLEARIAAVNENTGATEGLAKLRAAAMRAQLYRFSLNTPFFRHSHFGNAEYDNIKAMAAYEQKYLDMLLLRPDQKSAAVKKSDVKVPAIKEERLIQRLKPPKHSEVWPMWNTATEYTRENALEYTPERKKKDATKAPLVVTRNCTMMMFWDLARRENLQHVKDANNDAKYYFLKLTGHSAGALLEDVQLEPRPLDDMKWNDNYNIPFDALCDSGKLAIDPQPPSEADMSDEAVHRRTARSAAATVIEEEGPDSSGSVSKMIISGRFASCALFKDDDDTDELAKTVSGLSLFASDTSSGSETE